VPKRKEPEVRREPSQARSRERLERIQDAAAEVFAEVGFDAATMEGIAARADTSIGSVYQFFPNKRALLYAIAIRYAERVQRLFDEIVDGVSEGASWEAFLDQSLDALVDFHRREPGFRALVRNWSSQEFLAQDEASTREFTRRTEALIAQRFPELKAERRTTIAGVLVESVSALLITTSRRDPRHAPAIVAEWKAMLHRWLEPYATSARPRRSRAARTDTPSKAGSRRAPRPKGRSSS
jgi:AcrR family transcriptional regulator